MNLMFKVVTLLWEILIKKIKDCSNIYMEILQIWRVSFAVIAQIIFKGSLYVFKTLDVF